MKQIELKFDKTATGLAGNPFGRKVYEEQVKSKYKDYSEKLMIKFPDNIDKVASSFVQGFFSDLVEEIGYEGIEKNIIIEASNPELSKAIKDRLY